MPMTPAELLRRLDQGALPPVILIGGDNDYLVDNAFTTVREAIVTLKPNIRLESYAEVTDLSVVVDSYRTYSLFGGERLLVVPEVNAFVTKKELVPLYEKAIGDWKSAKTDRKRSGAVAKLLHLLGLVGLDVESSEGTIADLVGAGGPDPALKEMLESARLGGKRASRGEGDAALLAEAVSGGGAPGAILLLRTGEIPTGSATVAIIERAGAVVQCDLTREAAPGVLAQVIREIEKDSDSRFDPPAVARLRQKLGIERMLADKYSRDVPDVRLFANEAERLATFAGSGGKVTAAMVEEQVSEIAGGARYEFASLVTEGKMVEAVAKLRDLVAQAKRDEPSTPLDVIYGRFLFPLADELRQMLGIMSYARLNGLDLRRSLPYNSFKDRIADPLNNYLVSSKLARQKVHPFPLHKKFEAARRYREAQLTDALTRLAELDFKRKSGGLAPDVGIEALVLGLAAR